MENWMENDQGYPEEEKRELLEWRPIIMEIAMKKMAAELEYSIMVPRHHHPIPNFKIEFQYLPTYESFLKNTSKCAWRIEKYQK